MLILVVAAPGRAVAQPSAEGRLQVTASGGSCASAQLPAEFRGDSVPVLPYAGAAIVAGTDQAPEWGDRSWYGWKIMLTDPAAAAALFSGSPSPT